MTQESDPKIGDIWCSADNQRIFYTVLGLKQNHRVLIRRTDESTGIFDKILPIEDLKHDFYLYTRENFVLKPTEEIQTFDSGAVRKPAIHNYHSIPPEWIIALADIFGEGAESYGDYNWLKGLPISTYIDHLFDHLMRAISGDTTEDNWGKVAWNALAIKTTLEMHPEVMDIPWSK